MHLHAGGGTRTPRRIMILADFGLAIGEYRLVGHTVGYSRTPRAAHAGFRGGLLPRRRSGIAQPDSAAFAYPVLAVRRSQARAANFGCASQWNMARSAPAFHSFETEERHEPGADPDG